MMMIYTAHVISYSLDRLLSPQLTLFHVFYAFFERLNSAHENEGLQKPRAHIACSQVHYISHFTLYCSLLSSFSVLCAI